MFQTLYSRYHDQLDRRSGGENLFFPFPATYGGGMAQLERATYSLPATGRVETPKTFSWQDLSAMPETRQERRLVSAQGWTYRTRWEGVLLADLLKVLVPQPEATVLCQVNALGQEGPLPLEALLEGQALLCTRVDGQPLNSLYGGPIRLLVFDRYSHTGLGYLTSLKLLNAAEAGVIQSAWEQKGYPRDGVIQSGDYYAYDLQAFRPVSGPGEVTGY